MMVWKCPKCGSDELIVGIQTWARLYQSKDNFETDTDESDDGCQYWDGDSPMRCVTCGFSDKSREFETKAIA